MENVEVRDKNYIHVRNDRESFSICSHVSAVNMTVERRVMNGH